MVWLLTALHGKICTVPLVVNADTFRNPGVNPLRTSSVLAARAVDEENIGLAGGKERSGLASRPFDVPQTDRAIVERRHRKHSAYAIVSVIWVIELQSPSLHHGLVASVANSGRLQPVDAGWSIAMDVLAIPRDTFVGKRRVPVGHVLDLLPSLIPPPRLARHSLALLCIWSGLVAVAVGVAAIGLGALQRRSISVFAFGFVGQSATVLEVLVPGRFFEAASFPQFVVKAELLQLSRDQLQPGDVQGVEI